MNKTKHRRPLKEETYAKVAPLVMQVLEEAAGEPQTLNGISLLLEHRWEAWGIIRPVLERLAAQGVVASGRSEFINPRTRFPFHAMGYWLADLRKCRKCGCTTLDCRQCIAKTGGPCRWVEQDLCSACAEPAPKPKGRHR